MLYAKLHRLWAAIGELVPQGVTVSCFGSAGANGMTVHRDDEYRKDDCYGKPEANHPGLGLLVVAHLGLLVMTLPAGASGGAAAGTFVFSGLGASHGAGAIVLSHSKPASGRAIVASRGAPDAREGEKDPGGESLHRFFKYSVRI